MKTLYSQAVLAQFRAREKRCLRAAGALLGICLAICIYLCGFVNTGNADALLFCVIALSTLAGWADICLLVFAYAPVRAQSRHVAGILQEETAQYEGRLHVSREKIHIPKSIDICKATLQTNDETHALHVNVRFLEQLPANGTRVRVIAARRFITAYEVIHEEE